MMDISTLKSFVVSWNNRFPLDRWWRNKHGVPFMSPTHRESSFLMQLVEFEEDRMYAELCSRMTQRTPQEDALQYVPGSGDIFKLSTSIEDFTQEAEKEIAEVLKIEE